MIKNTIERDTRRLHQALKTVSASFIALAIFKGIQLLLGYEEQELYQAYPISWWIAVGLGFLFIGGLFYAVKKNYDLHPNIQLRSKPDHVLESVLTDPSFESWHDEAARLLAKRGKAQPPAVGNEGHRGGN